jgi:hypothetical protein
MLKLNVILVIRYYPSLLLEFFFLAKILSLIYYFKKKIEKLQSELHFIESESIEDEMEIDDKIKEKVSQPQHIIFVDTLKEGNLLIFNFFKNS